MDYDCRDSCSENNSTHGCNHCCAYLRYPCRHGFSEAIWRADCRRFLPGTFSQADQTERGTIEVLSFHAIKCLTTGEGGMALSNDASLLEQMRGFRDGVDSHLAMRIASPMTDIQGALGLSQLVRYDDFLKRRRDIAEQYFAELYDLPVQLPECIRNESIFFRFPLRVHGDFYAYRNRFDALNVQVRQGVDALLHRISGEDRRLFPVAEQLFAETLSIPIYPTLRDVEVQAVIAACRRVLGSGRS